MEAMRVLKKRKVVKSSTPAKVVGDTVSKDQVEAEHEQTGNLTFTEQRYPEWVRQPQCSSIRWLWDLGLALNLRCPTFTGLLLLKIVLWVTIVWILSYLHMGPPCFLLALTCWLYAGPLQRALDWATARARLLRGRGQAAPRPRRSHKDDQMLRSN